MVVVKVDSRVRQEDLMGRRWLAVALSPLSLKDDSQGKQGDWVLNHHDSKANTPRERQTFWPPVLYQRFWTVVTRLVLWIVLFVQKHDCDKFSHSFSFPLTLTPSDWNSLCWKVTWVTSVLTSQALSRFGGFPSRLDWTDDKIRCPLCLHQRLEEKDQVRDEWKERWTNCFRRLKI